MSRRWMGIALATSVTVAGLGAQAPATEGRTYVHAVVAEEGTGRPLEHAEVRIRELGRVGRANWFGEIGLKDVPAGVYQFEAWYPGYQRVAATLLVTGDTIGPVFMLPRLPAAALDTVRVTADPVPFHLAEFTRRKALGVGRFIEEKSLAREGERDLPIVLAARLPGLLAVPDRSRPGRYLLSSSRGPQHLGGLECDVDVYLDGARFRGELDEVHPKDLAGVEAYPMSAAPVEYRRSRGACHVVLLWSRW